jgi:hypothetical protein
VQVLRNCLPWGKDKYGLHHQGRSLNGSSGQLRTLKSVILTRGNHSSHGGNNNLHLNLNVGGTTLNGRVCGLLMEKTAASGNHNGRLLWWYEAEGESQNEAYELKEGIMIPNPRNASFVGEEGILFH